MHDTPIGVNNFRYYGYLSFNLNNIFNLQFQMYIR